MLALNVSVVTDANTSSFLKWDAIGKLLADGTSSSSSSSTPAGCCGTTLLYCYNGGCNTGQCSIDAGITIAGYGLTAAGSVGSCEDGSFACCTIRCKCYPKSDYKESSSVTDLDLP